MQQGQSGHGLVLQQVCRRLCFNGRQGCFVQQVGSGWVLLQERFNRHQGQEVCQEGQQDVRIVGRQLIRNVPGLVPA